LLKASFLKTLKTLYRVEPEIVNTYYTRAIQSIPPALTAKGKDEYVARLLEVIDVVCSEDGESYTRQLKSLLEVAEDGKTVLEGLVELVLSRIRQGLKLLLSKLFPFELT
jgi:AP-4 complex subunit epsilon-1